MKYVTACEIDAWTIETWPKDDPDLHSFRVFRCHSWRHRGECQVWKGQQDYTRIKDALDSRDFWMHVTLTYPLHQYSDIKKLYSWGCVHWSKLRKRLHRRFGKFEYIQIWEVTRRDVPHCHMAVTSERLYSECGRDPINNFHRLIQEAAIECGFGKVGWCEKIRSRVGMSGYLLKLERELTGKAKGCQIPIDSPPHFRRLRASRGLLPPVLKDPDITGALRFWDLEGKIHEGEIIERESQKKLAGKDASESRSSIFVPPKLRAL